MFALCSPLSPLKSSLSVGNGYPGAVTGIAWYGNCLETTRLPSGEHAQAGDVVQGGPCGTFWESKEA